MAKSCCGRIAVVVEAMSCKWELRCPLSTAPYHTCSCLFSSDSHSHPSHQAVSFRGTSSCSDMNSSAALQGHTCRLESKAFCLNPANSPNAARRWAAHAASWKIRTLSCSHPPPQTTRVGSHQSASVGQAVSDLQRPSHGSCHAPACGQGRTESRRSLPLGTPSLEPTNSCVTAALHQRARCAM